MAKTKRKVSKAEATDISQQYKRAWDFYHPIRTTFDDKERFVYSDLKDSLSDSTKSQVNDPRLLTIMQERAYRVMSQLASGKVQALARKDKGKSLAMDLLLNNYIIPNARQQYPILQKLRMVDFYSFVYGTQGVLVDYIVDRDYIGPDFYLIQARNLIPQPGAISMYDADYVFVQTKATKSWLKNRKGDDWDNIDELLKKSEGDNKAVGSGAYEEQSYAERTFGDQFTENIDEYQKITLVTRYERDRWVTVAPDYNIAIRDCDNKHDNDELPVLAKDAFSLADRFHGLGEIEKAETLQNAVNSLINLYLDGVKYSIFPPTKIDLNGVVASTIKLHPGAKWVMKNGRMDAVQPHLVSPQGLQTFNSTYSFLIAALMNQAGTTDTTTSSNVDPGLGKTPQALELLKQRENSRDAHDRFMMEQFVEDLYDRMINLTAKKQEKPVKISMFGDEFKQIADRHEDVVEMYESGEAGDIVINPKDIKDVEFRFQIDAGSTYKRDEALENQSLTEMMQLVSSLPGAAEQIMQTGKVRMGENEIQFSEMLKRWYITRGIQDWDKIITDIEEDEFNIENDPELAQLFQEVANFGQGGLNGATNPGIGATPPVQEGAAPGINPGF